MTGSVSTHACDKVTKSSSCHRGPGSLFCRIAVLRQDFDVCSSFHRQWTVCCFPSIRPLCPHLIGSQYSSKVKRFIALDSFAAMNKLSFSPHTFAVVVYCITPYTSRCASLSNCRSISSRELYFPVRFVTSRKTCSSFRRRLRQRHRRRNRCVTRSLRGKLLGARGSYGTAPRHPPCCAFSVSRNVN